MGVLLVMNSEISYGKLSRHSPSDEYLAKQFSLRFCVRVTVLIYLCKINFIIAILH
jgi:hypothetical protein